MSDLVNGWDHTLSLDWVLILSFVFGGCCSNVWALEAVLQRVPASGTFLTFAQFAFVTIQNASSQIVFDRKPLGIRVKRREVPLSRWLVQVVLFLGVSLINNYVFALKIPVTLHIIFRSGGLCVSMLMGYLTGKRRFTMGQVLAGLLITVGIIVATISTPRKAAASSSTGFEFGLGITLLSLALFLSAWLGLYQEETYRRYGKRWQEGLFYTHLLSLPFFLPLYPSLSATYRSFKNTPALSFGGISLPSAIIALLINVTTQSLCIGGVNRLTATVGGLLARALLTTQRVNSTTVNLVLTVRKALSLAISACYYGTGLNAGLITGGTMVLVGTAMYSATAETAVDAKRQEPQSATESNARASSPARRAGLRKRTVL